MSRSNHNTQKDFYNCLDAHLINSLLHLFESDKLIDEIKLLRKQYGLNQTNIDISSEVENSKKNGYSLYIIFKKNGEDFLHFSIHLCPFTFKNKYIKKSKIKNFNSSLHFKRNNIKIPNKNIPVLPIRIQQNENKIELSLGTPLIHNKQYQFNSSLVTEAQIIIDLLNKFLKNNPTKTTLSLQEHQILNTLLKKMNQSEATRKNKGRFYKSRKTRRNNGR